MPYPLTVQEVMKALFAGPGSLAPETRLAIAKRATETSGGTLAGGEAPEALHAFIEKVTRESHRITDEDLAQLQAAGYTEDQVYEATVAAAFGAGLALFERGLRAVGEPQ
ncbi:MAG TPA: hypothetical protein VII38_20700 [Polyangia bacterium]|jgi:alkylhydroperoxidase family enzyme